MLTAREISSGLGPLLKRPLPPEADGRKFSRVVVDSRIVEPGDLFVALRGEHADGHQFIPDALQRGAAGVIARNGALPEDLEGRGAVFLVEDPLNALQQLALSRRLALGARTIGITGSVGKTTTKEAVAGLLAHVFPVLKSRGNLNTEIGLPLALLELEPEHRYLVVEMGMNALGEIAELCRLARPDIGIVTNVGPVHLERLGSIERITDAKAELVESLPAEGVAILNADDPRVLSMSGRTAARTVTYGLSGAADCGARDIEVHGLEGVSFELTWLGNTRTVRAPLPGRHSIYACLAAAATALTEGLSFDQVAEGLSSLEAESRIKVLTARSGAIVLDDSYNASPASVKAALDLLGEMPGRRVAVLGDMLELGAEEEPGHREVGRYALTRVDELILIGPRMALAAVTAKDAGLEAVQHFEDKARALDYVRTLAKAETYVLVKASRGIALEELANAL